MDTQYLLTPVIDVDDGNELKSFRMYHIFAIAFVCGLVPAAILGLRNCLWLRARKAIMITFTVLCVAALIAKFIVLGSFYHAHYGEIRKNPNLERSTLTRQLPSAVKDPAADKQVEKTPSEMEWEQLKDNALVAERIAALALLGGLYLLLRKKYNIVQNLTDTVQPILKWGIATIVLAVLFELILSQLFFGGTL